MDVISAAAVLVSLVAFTSSSLTVVGQITRSSATISALEGELGLIEIILRESADALKSFSSMPESIYICLQRCQEKRDAAAILMDKISPISKDRKSAFRTARLILLSTKYEARIVAAYNSFRDSVLLLRDLTSEYVP